MDKWEDKKNRLAVLLEKRNSIGVSREEASEIHEIQKQLWARERRLVENRSANALSKRMFGKRLADMTEDELRAYRREQYKKTHPAEAYGTAIVRHVFGKPVRELNKAEREEYLKIIGCYVPPKENPYKESLVRQMFGKPIKELTRLEFNQYLKALEKRRSLP